MPATVLLKLIYCKRYTMGNKLDTNKKWNINKPITIRSDVLGDLKKPMADVDVMRKDADFSEYRPAPGRSCSPSFII
jgi:hypothetical protein